MTRVYSLYSLCRNSISLSPNKALQFRSNCAFVLLDNEYELWIYRPTFDDKFKISVAPQLFNK